MPYKVQNIIIANTVLDRRVKMTEEKKQSAFVMYKEGAAIRAIARHFKVDKRTIQFLLFPERKQRCLEHRKERGGWKQYYLKEKHAAYVKSHRRYKHKVLSIKK